ncbi:SpoIID/LytB domain-containing protein [Sporolituus thermophilus]|uniref:Stage II sporulation protein D n=1 Tax=Sporolituus thermophilus DSM 23256 TaxID=1123285 RepID=A0A1G7IEX9_9FIRM|nr:SpoIID/LytB domain-containing protein [Sporolituus thermophilus]SDF11301.1 stage II sporulation protein D [Sporolituus thermophilus DSM 23256]
MIRRIIYLTALLCFFVSAAAGAQVSPQSARAAEPLIRVGIWTNQPNVLVSASRPFTIVDRMSDEVLGVYQAGERVSLAYKNGVIVLNGKPLETRSIGVVLNGKGERYIEVNKRRYRGDIEVHPTHGETGLTVVNILPVEQYLYGIIAREISPEWAIEAVKAQAVAARTYALYNLGKHADDGFDVCATTDCQVYGGRDSEAPRATQAVDETRGMVIQYRGQLISAYFHSSGGGYTENSENVWGTYRPYLRGVPDFDQAAPHFKWEKQVAVTELEELLRQSGYGIGRLQAVELSRLTAPPVAASDRGVSGRVKTIRFIGDQGTVQLTGVKVRSLLGLSSTLFDLAIVVPVPKTFEVEITDSYGDHDKKLVEINLPPRPEQAWFGDQPNIRRFTGRPNEKIVITGYGWGHGVGLSQWGAKAMAEKAPPGDTAYFKEILKHYYQGVDIAKIY